MNNLVVDEYLAVATSDIYPKYAPVSCKDIFCFKPPNHIYTYSVAMAIRKNVPHTTQINNIIQRLLEAGLIQKWQSDVKENKELDVESFTLVVLSAKHFAGSLFVLSGGFTLGITSLILERIVYRKIKNGENCAWANFLYKWFYTK